MLTWLLIQPPSMLLAKSVSLANKLHLLAPTNRHREIQNLLFNGFQSLRTSYTNWENFAKFLPKHRRSYIQQIEYNLYRNDRGRDPEVHLCYQSVVYFLVAVHRNQSAALEILGSAIELYGEAILIIKVD